MYTRRFELYWSERSHEIADVGGLSHGSGPWRAIERNPLVAERTVCVRRRTSIQQGARRGSGLLEANRFPGQGTYLLGVGATQYPATLHESVTDAHAGAGRGQAPGHAPP
jgi:hypothetical protein